jgi:hypothetical protein
MTVPGTGGIVSVLGVLVTGRAVRVAS